MRNLPNRRAATRSPNLTGEESNNGVVKFVDLKFVEGRGGHFHRHDTAPDGSAIVDEKNRVEGALPRLF